MLLSTTRRHTLTLVAVVLLTTWPASADVIYVDGDATGANSGSSWEDAYTDLQDALGVALSGDQVWVAQGTYKPSGPAGDVLATYQLLSGVGLYGGFAGGETELDQRDPDVNVTVLSGDLNGDDGPDFENYDENSHHSGHGKQR